MDLICIAIVGMIFGAVLEAFREAIQSGAMRRKAYPPGALVRHKLDNTIGMLLDSDGYYGLRVRTVKDTHYWQPCEIVPLTELETQQYYAMKTLVTSAKAMLN